MSVDILFVAQNRREFTAATMAALLDNTNWHQVGTLYVHDDGSTDGTREMLRDWVFDLPCSIVFHAQHLGSPVAVMNWYLDQPSDRNFVKIDNDFVVCPGWLDQTLRAAHLNAGMDAIGIAPWEGPPVLKGPREVTPASHIGGVGLIRRRMFSLCRPVPNGRFGWTEHQTNHPFQVGWLKPDMPCFELDRCPAEPWVSLSAGYVANGWQREWPPYENPAYWDWFVA